MSNNFYNATEVPQNSSGEGPEKIPQEKGSKKRINNHQTDDDNLHQDDKPTSECDPSSLQRWQQQQQQHYENIFLQQHGNFPEEYDIKFPDTGDKSAAQCLDDSFHNVGLSAEDFVSDNYAYKSLDNGGGGTAACGAADSMQPTTPIRNNSSDVVSRIIISQTHQHHYHHLYR